MVKKIFYFLAREIGGLHQAAYVLGAFTLLSQLLGLIRDRLLAHTFGVGATLDTYYAAFRIPDLVLVIAASVVSISVLVPVLTERLEKSKEEARRFLDSVFTVFFLSIVLVGIALFFLIPVLSRILFPGFDESQMPALITMTRILLLSPIFLGASNLFASIVQVHRKFLLYSFSPILYNIGIIAGVLFLYPIFGVTGLVWGVVLGALAHVGILIPAAGGLRLLPHLTRSIEWQRVKKIFLSSVPRSIALSMGQIEVLVLLSMASLLEPGSISVFNFALNIQSVPLGVIGVSYSLAAFPVLSKFFTQGNMDKFLDQVATAARHIVFLSLPIAVLFIVLRAQIVRTVLGSGAFDWDATRLTAAALALFVVSIVAQCLGLLFVRAYYAMGKTTIPVTMALLSGVATIASAYGFLWLWSNSAFFAFFLEDLFKVAGTEGARILALPLAYTLGAIIETLLLALFFLKDFRPALRGFSPLRAGRVLWQSSASAVVAGYVTYLFLDVFDDVFNIQTLAGIFLQGLCAGCVGILAALLILIALENRETMEALRALQRKIWKVEVVAPGPEELS